MVIPQRAKVADNQFVDMILRHQPSHSLGVNLETWNRLVDLPVIHDPCSKMLLRVSSRDAIARPISNVELTLTSAVVSRRWEHSGKRNSGLSRTTSVAVRQV